MIEFKFTEYPKVNIDVVPNYTYILRNNTGDNIIYKDQIIRDGETFIENDIEIVVPKYRSPIHNRD